jgi:hypothetical protein
MMGVRLRLLIWFILAGTAMAQSVAGSAKARSSPPAATPGGPVTPFVDRAKAYLFAHMIKKQCGVLCYSVSLDGFHWLRGS